MKIVADENLAFTEYFSCAMKYCGLIGFVLNGSVWRYHVKVRPGWGHKHHCHDCRDN
jgi:hypothetical protein